MGVTIVMLLLAVSPVVILLAWLIYLLLNRRRFGLLEARARGAAGVHEKMNRDYGFWLAESRWIYAAANRQTRMEIAICDSHNHVMAATEDEGWTCMASTCCHRLTCKPAAAELFWTGRAKTEVDLPCGHSDSEWHQDDQAPRWVLMCKACHHILASQPFGQGP